MQKPKPQKLTPRAMGLLFLVPGIVCAIPHIVSGTFEGAIMGFSTFCVLFGMCMLFVRPRR
jgi:hypothetical protein